MFFNYCIILYGCKRYRSKFSVPDPDKKITNMPVDNKFRVDPEKNPNMHSIELPVVEG